MKLLLAAVVTTLIVIMKPAGATQPSPSDPTLADGPRTDHALGFYDAALRRVVLIGGAGDPRDGERDTVWSWSGVRWEFVTAAGPPGRVNAGAAYDGSSSRAVLAGGARKPRDGTAWQIVQDGWAGGPGGWKPIGDITPRDHHALVDDGRGGVLMFGGIPSDRSAPWPNDTWRLRGDNWSRVSTSGPAARGRTAMAFDSRRNQVVLFGGVSAPAGPDQAQAFFGDTWVWNGSEWRKVAEAGPPARYAHGMVFDERAGVVLIYGGAAAHRGAPLSDMWRWDGREWTEIRLTGPTPGHRYQPVMVYDHARDRTVLYSGIGASGDTWEWNGTGWRQMTK